MIDEETIKHIRRRVPAGFELVVVDQPGQQAVFVTHGRAVVTVINPMMDVEAQVAEDICEAHRAFCCPSCTDQGIAFTVQASS